MTFVRTKTPEERFDAKVLITDNHHIWQGALSQGYGVFWNGERYEGAHVFSFLRHGGVLEPGEQVLHHCDFKPCVRFEHLFGGTQASNIADMVAKNRQAKGSQDGNAKLTENLVIQMRLEYFLRRDEKGIQKRLAFKYGVTPSTACSVLNRLTWRHC